MEPVRSVSVRPLSTAGMFCCGFFVLFIAACRQVEEISVRTAMDQAVRREDVSYPLPLTPGLCRLRDGR